MILKVGGGGGGYVPRVPRVIYAPFFSTQNWVKYGLTQLLGEKFNVKFLPNSWVSPYITQSQECLLFAYMYTSVTL